LRGIKHGRFGRSRVLPLAALLLIVVSPTPVLAAASAEDIEAAVETALSGGDYQRELPVPDPSEGEGGGGLWSDPDWWRNEGEAQAPDLYRPAPEQMDQDSFNLNLPPELIKVLRMLMWAVLFAGGGLLVYYLVNEAAQYFRWKKRGQAEGEPGNGMEGEDSPAGFVLEDFDSLAARGDYAGAIHALLLHSLLRLGERGAEFSSAMTSREILRRLKLGQAEREAMSVLVRMTEVTHFGGREASESDFRECRALFEQITAEQPA
jgi:hypothetical protein